MPLKDWVGEINPSEVSIDTLKAIIRNNEMMIENRRGIACTELKEETELLKKVLRKAEEVQR